MMSHSNRLRPAALFRCSCVPRGVAAVLVAIVLSALAPAPGAAQQAGQAADPARAGRYDNGKMWTFDVPPVDYLRATYGFTPDAAWFEKARLGALRIPGCSASLVSARGLVMTNHHCGREATTSVTKPGENFLDNGFYARTQADERKADEMYAEQLIAIVDVTAEVDAAAAAAGNPEAAAEAREAKHEEIKARIAAEHGGEEKGMVVEIVSLYQGAKTSAYVFKRYEDVRLVMTPELQMGYFGGDPDNFTYPRYALDMTFFRLYGENGQPLETPEHFRWSEKGVAAGDLVFVIGNPGSTSRLQTVAELEFRRDVQDVAVLRLLDTRIAVLEQFLKEHPDAPEEIRNELFSLLNSQKAYRGIVKGLKDVTIMARRADMERQVREAIAAKPELATMYGTLIDDMVKLQQQKRQHAAEFSAFAAVGNPGFDGTALVRGYYAAQYIGAKMGGAPAEALAELHSAILDVDEQPAALQELLVAARLRDIEAAFGKDNPRVTSVLNGRSAEGAAAMAVQQSVLSDSAKARQALDDGTLTLADPALQLARAVLSSFGPYQQAIQPISRQEEDIARDIGRAHFAIWGTAVPPDATFSLRIADGVVGSYEYNGTVAPPYTTLYGLFDRHYSHASKDWALPDQWLKAAATLKLSTPMNFVSTADIIGGNSGSPVLDRDLRVVGLVFDSNIEGLPGDYIYLDDRARAVAVDARGILEALRAVYRADRLVQELTGAAAPARR